MTFSLANHSHFDNFNLLYENIFSSSFENTSNLNFLARIDLLDTFVFISMRDHVIIPSN